MSDVIRSPANPLIKRLRRLHKAAGRREQACFLLEGRRAIDGFLRAGLQPSACFLREDLLPPEGWPEPQLLSAEALAKLSQHKECAGYLAVFPLPADAVIDAAAGGLCCWGLRDPGNVGTVLRSAAAFGVAQVLLVDCCDPWSSKVLQASAGAMAGLAIARADAETAQGMLAEAAPAVALVVSDGEPELSLAGPCWLLVGGEADGLPAPVVAACEQRLSLPMASAVESLNAAVAASIALYLSSIR